MSKPLVAIIGRPNVGKSTLFNRLVGKRISIVEDTPGVTRDRIYADADWAGKAFTIIDTGGIEISNTDKMWIHIKQQVQIAIDLADVILFIVDGREGIMPDDYDIATMLRKTKKPIVLAVNKIEGKNKDSYFDFYQLSIGEPIPVSASQGLNTGDLLDAIIKNFADLKLLEDEDDDAIHIAVVGKPNVGKSSLVNQLLGFKRTIVTKIAGTTRDSIDTPFVWQDQKYVLIDTAGLRRKSKVSDNVEYYSNIRSVGAIRKADIVIIILDATQKISEQDVRICGLVHESDKPSLIVINKWDLIGKDTLTKNTFNNQLLEDLKFMSYFKSLYISALTGKSVNTILPAINEVYQKASQRISTSALNEVLHDAIAMNEPPTKVGQRLKIFYITQVSTNPPTLVMFVNDPRIMHFSYKRYLENSLRKAFDFTGTPIKLLIRKRSDK